MGNYLGNIGEVNTASVTVIASMGAVADVNVINSAGWTVSVANTGAPVNIINSAGWLVSVENTATVVVAGTIVMGSSFIISNSSELQTLVTNTATFIDIVNSAGWVVDVANTGGAYSLINTAGWVVSVANTGGIDVQLLAGSALIGTANVLLMNDSVNIVNSAGWVIDVANTGGAYSLINTAGWIVNGGSSLIENSANWIVSGSMNIQNSAGWLVNVENTGGTVNVANTGGAYSLINTAGWVVSAPDETDSVSSSGTVVVVSHTSFEVSATTSAVVHPQVGKTLRVLSYEIMAGAANQVLWQSGSTNNKLLTGTKFLAASGGMVAPYNPVGWFQTEVGSGLALTCNFATSLGGCITYVVL